MARTPIDKNSRQYLSGQVRTGRSAILAILVLTILNIAFLLLNYDRYFLFSASIPYYLTTVCLLVDNGWLDGPIDVTNLQIGKLAVIAIVISIVILAVYLVCWLLSKKKSTGLIIALVFFCIDTVVLIPATLLLLENPTSNILDFVLHAFAIWQLAVGVSAAEKLKKLPAAQETVPAEPERPTASPEF